jgi:hypothetical protein
MEKISDYEIINLNKLLAAFPADLTLQSHANRH